MPPKLSDETIQRIIKSHERGLSIKEGSAFAGVSPKTFRDECKKLGLKANIKQHGEPQWSKEEIAEQLKRVRIKEGTGGLWSRIIRKNHSGLYTATLYHFDEGYSEAFEAAFGFPYSKAAMYLVLHIHELWKSEKEINPVVLSSETGGFRKVIKAGHFDNIYQFATTVPELRKKTKREIYEVLARMVLQYLPNPGSYITLGMKYVFPAPYKEEAADLLALGELLELIIHNRRDGTTIYVASETAVQTACQILDSLDTITGTYEGASTKRYFERVRSIGDVFAECPELRDIIGDGSPFSKPIVEARRRIPPEKAPLFYDTLMKTPGEDGYQGARYMRMLPRVGTDRFYDFMEWVIKQEKLTGLQFDKELGKGGIKAKGYVL